MTSGLVRPQTPEERELDRKRAELAKLQTELAERELDLATLQAELRAFERRYLRIVGVRYAQLDELEAQIAEALARRAPTDGRAQERAAHARAQAHESAGATRAARAEEPAPEFVPSARLKSLYREVAKRVHPDLATDDDDRAARHKAMADANQAYEAGDERRLEAILREWESRPESVKGEGPGAELVRIIRRLAQVEQRLQAIDTQVADLKSSHLYQLKQKTIEAEREGRDLLADMAAQIDEQMRDAQGRLAELTRTTTHS